MQITCNSGEKFGKIKAEGRVHIKIFLYARHLSNKNNIPFINKFWRDDDEEL